MQQAIIKIIIFSLLFIALPTPRTATAAVLARPPSNLGLVGYWNFDEGAGTVAGDSSGSGNHGTITGATWVDGKRGKALDFNGTSDFVDLFNPTSLYVSGDVTLSAWVKPRTLNSNFARNVIVSGRRTESSPVYGLLVSPTSVGTSFQTDNLSNGSLGYVNRVGSTNINYNEWVMVSVVRSGLNLYFYKNDVLIGQDTFLSGNLYSSNGYLIGKGYNGGSFFFDGLIDDVRIYNRALSAGEIARLYSSGQVTRKTVSNQGLVGYWSFDEGAGAIAGDSSGSGNHGTITGATWVGGKRGKALSFPGTGNPRVVVNDSVNLKFGTGSFSVSGWGLHRDYTYPKSNFMLRKSVQCFTSGTANAGFDIGHGYKANGIDICLRDSSNNAIRSTLVFDDGYRPDQLIRKWTHYTIVFDRVGNVIQAYVNGVKQTNELNISSVTGGIDNDQAVNIGTMYGWQTDGILDDVRIYNRALSAGEIAKLYQQSSATINSSQNNKMTDGLVGLWSFDGKDISGTTAFDRSGQGNHGTIVGAKPTIGKIGQALGFNGSNSYAETAPSNFNINGNIMSMSVWVNPLNYINDGLIREVFRHEYKDSSNQGGYLFSWRGDWSDVWEVGIRLNDNGTLKFNYCSSMNQSVIPANTWTNIIFVSDGSDFKCYVNGALHGSTVLNNGNIQGGKSLIIGAYSVNGGAKSRFFNGSIDDVRIYNRALSAEEVKQLYLMGK